MENSTIQVNDLTFKILLKEKDIKARIAEIGNQISQDYEDKKNTVFVGILNGAFMFVGELMQHIKIPCNISFAQMSSYSGSSSTGEVKEVIGFSSSLKDKHVIIVEDIVDTGLTIDYLLKELLKQQPASVKVASLLMKREAYKIEHNIDYVGFEIPNKFVVGFGLDYNQKGRNYPDIYEKC